MVRNYAVLNPNAVGPTLELDSGGTIVRSNTNATDTHRLARANQAIASGVGYYEAVFYGDGMLLNHAVVGIVQGQHSLSKYPGEDSTGFGFKLSGGIWSNNVQVTTCSEVLKKTTVGVLVDLAALTATWYVENSIRAVVTLPSGKTWFPAVSVSGANAYDLTCFVNFGQRAFKQKALKQLGWYQQQRALSATYLCSVQEGGYIDTSTTAGINYLPRILDADRFSVSRVGAPWPWASPGSTNSSTAASFATLTVDNYDGLYDAFLTNDSRDTPVVAQLVRVDQPLSAASTRATMLVDKVEPIDEYTLRFQFKDVIAQLDVAAQTDLYPPFFDAGIANRPQAILIGANRNVPLQLSDQVNRLYPLSDIPVSNVTTVRDKGAPLDPRAAPPQYTVLGDVQTLQLQTLPVGLLTADISSQGQQVVIPGPVDALGGIGRFLAATWPSTVPNGFTLAGSGTLAKAGIAQGYSQNYMVSLTTSRTYNPASSDYGKYLVTSSNLLKAGHSYRISVKIVYSDGNPPSVDGGLTFGLMLRTDLLQGVEGAVSPNLQPVITGFVGLYSYTFTYTVPGIVARPLYLIVVSSQSPASGAGNGSATVIFYDVVAEEITAAPQALPLQGVKLESYMREFIENRANLTPADWVASDATALDTATGYTLGTYIVDPITQRQALELPLSSYCAVLFTDRLGRLRVRRLVDPAQQPSSSVVAAFDETNVRMPVIAKPDYAPGLTTLIGVRRNHKVFTDSDFVTDFATVPASLRTQFKRQFQFVKQSSITPAGQYNFAVNANSLPTLFDVEAYGQAEIDRVLSYWRANRSVPGTLTPAIPRFISFTAFFDGVPPELYFGDIITLLYPRFGFTTLTQLMVVNTVERPYAQELDLICSG